MVANHYWSRNPRVREGFAKRAIPAARVTVYLPGESAAEPLGHGRWWENSYRVASLTIGHQESVTLTRSRGEFAPRQERAGAPWVFPVPWRLLSHEHLKVRFAPISADPAQDANPASHGWFLQVGADRAPANPIYRRAWGEKHWNRIDGFDRFVLSPQLNAFVLPFDDHPRAMLTIETNGGRLPSTTPHEDGNDDPTPKVPPHSASRWPRGQLNAVIAVFADALAWPPPPPAGSEGHVESIAAKSWDELPPRIKANWGAARKVESRRPLFGNSPAETDLRRFLVQEVLTYPSVFFATTATPGDSDSYTESTDPPAFRPPHLERVEFFV